MNKVLIMNEIHKLKLCVCMGKNHINKQCIDNLIKKLEQCPILYSLDGTKCVQRGIYQNLIKKVV